MTTRSHGDTRISFARKYAYIQHSGRAGDTETTIAANVDAMLGAGAFDRLRDGASFEQESDYLLDDPEGSYTLNVDPKLAARIAEDAAPIAPEGETVDFDFTGCDIVHSTTRNGDACATIRNAGLRTTMAYGPVADAVRGVTKAHVIIRRAGSVDKIVGLYLPRDEEDDILVVEPARAA